MDDDPLALRSRWIEPPFRERRSALISGQRLDGNTTDWRGVDLRGARIDGGLQSGVQLDFAQLDGADLQNLDLSEAASIGAGRSLVRGS